MRTDAATWIYGTLTSPSAAVTQAARRPETAEPRRFSLPQQDDARSAPRPAAWREGSTGAPSREAFRPIAAEPAAPAERDDGTARPDVTAQATAARAPARNVRDDRRGGAGGTRSEPRPADGPQTRDDAPTKAESDPRASSTPDADAKDAPAKTQAKQDPLEAAPGARADGASAGAAATAPPPIPAVALVPATIAPSPAGQGGPPAGGVADAAALGQAGATSTGASAEPGPAAKADTASDTTSASPAGSTPDAATAPGAAETAAPQGQGTSQAASAALAGPVPAATAPGAHAAGGAGAGAAAAPEARTPQTMQVSTTIAGVPIEVGMRAMAGTSRFDIRLSPGDLGRVDVRLEIDKDSSTVKAHLTVERPETLALLRRDAGQLQEALSQAGFSAAEGSINLSLQDPSQGGGQGAQQGQGEARARAAPETAAPGAPAPAAPQRSTRAQAASPGGLDLLI